MADEATLVLDIDLLGEKQVARSIRRLQREVGDLKPFFEDVAKYIRGRTRENFDSENQTGRRGKWAALSHKYKAWKEENYPGMPILVLTGKLRAAATNTDQPGSIHRVSDDYLEIGIDGDVIPYAVAHQHGIPGRLHQRPVYDLDNNDKQALTEIARDHILRAAGRAGLGVGEGTVAEVAALRQFAIKSEARRAANRARSAARRAAGG